MFAMLEKHSDLLETVETLLLLDKNVALGKILVFTIGMFENSVGHKFKNVCASYDVKSYPRNNNGGVDFVGQHSCSC